MTSLFSKAIVGGVAAIAVCLLYFCISGILTVLKNRKKLPQKNFSSEKQLTKSNNTKELNSSVHIVESNQRIAQKNQFMILRTIRAFLFIIIGCLSFYYATQCTYAYQSDGMNAKFFGKDNELEDVANELSTQILCVGLQASETITIIKLFQGLFIIIGLGCVTYGATSLKKE